VTVYYDKYRDCYGNNLVLRDMKYYRRERLIMNNPKNNAHLLRKFLEASKSNPWAASKFDLEHAEEVLTRLAHVEAINKNSE
jgi:hypothetical protein